MSEDPTLAEKIKANRVQQDLAQAEANRQREAQRQAEFEAEFERQQKEEFEKQKAELEKQEQAERDKKLAELEAKQEAERQAELEKQKQLQNIIDERDKKLAELEKQRIEALQGIVTPVYNENVGIGKRFRFSSDKEAAIGQVTREFNTKKREVIQEANASYSVTKALQVYPNYVLSGNVAREFKESGYQADLLSLIEKENQRREEQAYYARIYSSTKSKEEATRGKIDINTPFVSGTSVKTAESIAYKKQEEHEQTAREFEQAKEAATIDFLKTSPAFPFLTRTEQKPVSIYGTTPERSEKAVYTYEQTQQQQKNLESQLRHATTAGEATAIKEEYLKVNPYVGTRQVYIGNKGFLAQGVLIEKRLEEKFPETKTERYVELTPEGKLKETEIITTTEIENIIEKEPTKYIFLDKEGKEIEKPTPDQLWAFAYKQATTRPPETTETDKLLNKYIQDNLSSIKQLERQGGKPGQVVPLIEHDSLLGGIIGHSEELYATGYNLFQPKEKQIDYKPTLESLFFTDIFELAKYKLGIRQEPITESLTLKEIEEKSKTQGGLEYLAGSLITTGAVSYALTAFQPLILAKYQARFIDPKDYKKAVEIAQRIFVKDSDAYQIAMLREQNPQMSYQTAKDLAKKMSSEEQLMAEAEIKKQFPQMPQAQIEEIAKQIVKETKTLYEVEKLREQNPQMSYQTAKDLAKKMSRKEQLAEYEKEYLARLEKENPQMPQAQIEEIAKQIVEETKTLYKVEKIDKRTYLISSGTEASPTETPYIIMQFGRQGKSAIYEPVSDTETKATGILIKGVVQKNILEGQKIISTTKEAKKLQEPTTIKVGKTQVKATGKTPADPYDISYFPPTVKNIERIADEQFTKQIGTKKEILTKDLELYPKQVVESVTIEKPKQATKIYETAKLSDKPATTGDEFYKGGLGKKEFDYAAKDLPEPDSMLKEFDYAAKDLPESGSMLKGQKPKTPGPDDLDLSTKPRGQDINLDMPTQKGTAKIILESDQSIKTSLKDVATKTAQAESKVNVVEKTPAAGLTIPLSGLKVYATEGYLSGTKTETSTLAELQTKEQIDLTTKQELEDLSKLGDLSRQQQITTQNHEPDFFPRFSLITIGQQKRIPEQIPELSPKTKQDIRTDIILKQKQEQKTKLRDIVVTVERGTTKTPPPRIGPSVGIYMPDVIEKQVKKFTPENLKKFYFAWNVDMSRVGRYLPIQDLTTGPSPKAIEKVERAQRKSMKKGELDRRVKQAQEKLDTKLVKEEPKQRRRRTVKKEKPIFKKSFEDFTKKKPGKFRIRLR